MAALGDEFRSAREARGLTLSDVSEQIHIRSVYLSAIENEDWPAIGAAVYVRGFIRTYARFLGLESEGAIAKFNQTVPADRFASPSAAVVRDREWTGPSAWAWIGVLIALALAVFAGYEWWSYSQSRPSGLAAGPATPAPGVTLAAQPAASPPGSEARAVPGGAASPVATAVPNLHHALAIRLTQRSWLRVVVDGKTQIEGIFPAGTTRTFTGNAADVRVGNAGGVVIAVDGRPPAALGKDGDVVEQHFTL
jgi:cytoskeletal protein RodZ